MSVVLICELYLDGKLMITHYSYVNWGREPTINESSKVNKINFWWNNLGWKIESQQKWFPEANWY